MSPFQFIFSFLYTRNWHTGQLELSQPRIILFSSMLLLILLGIIIASVLHTPVVY